LVPISSLPIIIIQNSNVEIFIPKGINKIKIYPVQLPVLWFPGLVCTLVEDLKENLRQFLIFYGGKYSCLGFSKIAYHFFVYFSLFFPLSQ
jgi:hypothetical protein